MEIEKPFKCTVCNSKFTNEDHLQVHKRRHEMSLNLSKSGSQQQQSLLESFVDETPTPTRFFRNCEEVGLFQDLQNVNPFDEQFSKASATPSTGGEPFDFSLAISSSSVPPSASITSSTTASCISSKDNGNKRRYSDQDTLNTPQVFGYVVNSTSSTTNTCSTTSILTPMPPSLGSVDEGGNSKNTTTNPSNTPKPKSDTTNFQGTDSESSSSEETSLEKVVSGDSSANTSHGGKLCKAKVNLRLKLSPSLPFILQEPDSPDSKLAKLTPSTPLVPEKKAEQLERNKAAAARSRQRRKQWVYNLESKCETLEWMLAQTRAELSQQHTENQILRNELSRHANCDVSREVQREGEITILVPQTVSQVSQPNILRQISQSTVLTAVSQSNGEVSLCSPVTVIIPRVKSKRGRPKKGNERRIDPLTVPVSANFLSSDEIPFKIEIQPLTRTIVAVSETPTRV